MSSTDRQNRLLVAEDWKRIYQSYRNADFKSYDFETLRRSMINYIRLNYPEDFNDYTESSEYLALIDLIAYLGQNLAFRIDLNARENFIELAERRESVLRLARLINYNPKRNQAASGLLKLVNVSSSESFTDSNNINLQNQIIVWNDPSNPNWYEQFIKIINRALPVNGTFGKPEKRETIQGILTEIYKFNNNDQSIPIFNFSRAVDGQTIKFELTSSDIVNNQVVEESPKPGNQFGLVYKADGQGPGSTNSGFFALFKQGTLDQGDFTVDNPSTTQIVSVDAININNNDLWLYKLDTNGVETDEWVKVEALQGNNIIYNSLNKNIRNVYSVLTRANDRVSLIFSDGVFGNLPKGSFRVYYRTSLNRSYSINPTDLSGISISFPYRTRTGKTENITFSFDLQYTVDNASVAETNNSIKQRAPSTYYTQNRLITGEDYQILPLSVNQKIIKVKSVNRISSGISRYFELTDATGKYSKTNLFGNDGILYQEDSVQKQKFTFATQTDIEGIIVNQIEAIIASEKIKNFYINRFPKYSVIDLNVSWNVVTEDTNYTTGFFENTNGIKQTLGNFTTSVLKLVRMSSAIKFVAPAGFHFDQDNFLKLGEATYKGSKSYIWTSVINVQSTGIIIQDDGSGPVLLNDYIPTGAILSEIRPFIAETFNDDLKIQIIDQVFNYKTFGLRFDRVLGEWKLIVENNLNVLDNFSIGKEGDVTNQKLDASWLLKFTSDGETYVIEYRTSRFIFESDKEIRFYFDSSDKVYDTASGKIIKDKISILNFNTKPDSSIENFTIDYDFAVTEEYRDPFGYINSKKVSVTFFDNDDDGIPDNSQMFEDIIEPSTNPSNKYIFQQKFTTIDGVEDFLYVSNNDLKIIVIASLLDLGTLSNYDDNQIFYFIAENLFQIYSKSTGLLTITTDYKAFIGRDSLKFHYIHAADDSTRIDPSVSNIIDIYVLTDDYDRQLRLWLDGTNNSKPLPPSSDSLYTSFGSSIEKYKALTDEIVYHHAKYRVLFGSKADVTLQAVFKVVKNPDLVLNDNTIKSNIIESIDEFFALDNWDFGETFYFTELVAYVMNSLAPNIVTFVIVPLQSDQVFGSFYEIKGEQNEIFISGATVSDIEIIDSVTAKRLQASGKVITNSSSVNSGIQSQ